MAYDHEQGVYDLGTKNDVYEKTENKDIELYNGEQVVQDNGILSKLRRLEARMDARLGIESEAITRKRPEDKKPVRWYETLTMFSLWASGTMNTSCFATGFIGVVDFGLNLRQTIGLVIAGTFLGSALTGYAATFGARTGLRQISVSRYAFGWWPNKIIALLNTIVQLGWAAVACITGGLALTAVADGHLSLIVGIVILAVFATIVSFVGLNAVLIYERYAWIAFFIVFMVFYGETGKYADNSPGLSTLEGADLSAACLTIFAISYGSSTSWQTMASDYYTQYPANTSRVKIFFLTTFGIAIPTCIGLIAGAVVASGFNNQPAWKDSYGEGLGFLIQTMLHPLGFAKFILVILVLSGIGVNVISIYSAAISCQQFARPFSRIPRFIWTLLCFAVILGLAVGGREKLNTYLTNFLSLLGYWCTQYFVILASEHIIFRKNNFDNYNLEGWNDPDVLPVGIAAATAFGLGIIAWVMGMNETWYVGPLSKLIGTYGGDLANEFTFAVTLIIFIPARYLELKYFGK
ncbi:NCS1 family nucleobase:cation symporter-1 [Myriangium duriaei CBS 260.36]|uniref:NCS1 family nucleobase:cation symporter-1 n=1 Tax=Myriangium duriaei CBS 260.36 TaxID=1168546 RepID=A0A9P4IYL8_9PEZI|nr:NCS1 family nucleobase:cation symporter-1 [Myriangium duriaei CBS 260.36]